MNIGTNAFCLAGEMYDDLKGTLKCLKDAGFTSLEPCIDFENPDRKPPENVPDYVIEMIRKISGGIWDRKLAAGKIETVRNAGLRVISAQIMTTGISCSGDLDRMSDEIVSLMADNDLKYCVMNLMADHAMVREFAPSLEKLALSLKERGIVPCYHNHEIEIVENDKGETVLDILLKEVPDIMLELDVGWVKFTGHDPLELMDRYQDRMALLHLKDIAENARPENRNSCFTAIGEGTLPLKEILRKAAETGLENDKVIIDQDNSRTNILEDLKKGIENCNKVASCTKK